MFHLISLRHLRTPSFLVILGRTSSFPLLWFALPWSSLRFHHRHLHYQSSFTMSHVYSWFISIVVCRIIIAIFSSNFAVHIERPDLPLYTITCRASTFCANLVCRLHQTWPMGFIFPAFSISIRHPPYLDLFSLLMHRRSSVIIHYSAIINPIFTSFLCTCVRHPVNQPVSSPVSSPVSLSHLSTSRRPLSGRRRLLFMHTYSAWSLHIISLPPSSPSPVREGMGEWNL